MANRELPVWLRRFPHEIYFDVNRILVTIPARYADLFVEYFESKHIEIGEKDVDSFADFRTFYVTYTRADGYDSFEEQLEGLRMDFVEYLRERFGDTDPTKK